MEIINETFKNFGLTLAETKTKTMSWKTPEHIQIQPTMLSVNATPIENVDKFKYLGHWLHQNPNSKSYLNQQFGAAYGKWNEWKSVLTDHKIKLCTRVKFAESVIRSRLCYAVQTDRLKVAERATLDSVWTRMLRKMIKNGFAKKEDSRAYKYYNEDVLRICKTKSASQFCQVQHLKFLGHIARQENDTLQKKWLFTNFEKTKCQWLPLANDLQMDPVQLRKTIFDKDQLNKLLEVTSAPGSNAEVSF